MTLRSYSAQIRPGKGTSQAGAQSWAMLPRPGQLRITLRDRCGRPAIPAEQPAHSAGFSRAAPDRPVRRFLEPGEGPARRRPLFLHERQRRRGSNVIVWPWRTGQAWSVLLPLEPGLVIGVTAGGEQGNHRLFGHRPVWLSINVVTRTRKSVIEVIWRTLRSKRQTQNTRYAASPQPGVTRDAGRVRRSQVRGGLRATWPR